MNTAVKTKTKWMRRNMMLPQKMSRTFDLLISEARALKDKEHEMGKMKRFLSGNNFRVKSSASRKSRTLLVDREQGQENMRSIKETRMLWCNWNQLKTWYTYSHNNKSHHYESEHGKWKVNVILSRITSPMTGVKCFFFSPLFPFLYQS